MTLFESAEEARCCAHALEWHDDVGFCNYPGCHGRPPTLAEARVAGEVGQAMALASADDTWLIAAAGAIRGLASGETFIAEDVVIALTAEGITTSNAKAIGPVVARLAREGVIEKTGTARAARTSHGSLKPVWKRR